MKANMRENISQFMLTDCTRILGNKSKLL